MVSVAGWSLPGGVSLSRRGFRYPGVPLSGGPAIRGSHYPVCLSHGPEGIDGYRSWSMPFMGFYSFYPSCFPGLHETLAS